MEKKPGDVLTVDEFSHYPRISRSTLDKLAQEGRVPCQKVGRHWRLSKQTIDCWLGQGGANDIADAGNGT